VRTRPVVVAAVLYKHSEGETGTEKIRKKLKRGGQGAEQRKKGWSESEVLFYEEAGVRAKNKL